VVGSLHEAGRATVGVGAVSQAIFELDGKLADQSLRAALDQVSRRFPLIHGHFSRDYFNLAPYWKVPRSARAASIPLRVVDLPADADDPADRLLAEHVNTPFESDSIHIRFLLVRIGDRRSKLGLVFDHRLFDAFGAETFFRLLEEAFQDRLDDVAPRVAITEPAHLDHWKRRFLAGQTLNRLLIELQKEDVCALAMPTPTQGRQVKFVHASLTVEQTAQLNMTVSKEINVPIILPSMAARAVAAVEHVIPRPALPGSQWLLFTSANMRSAGQEWESMFFNHFSFLLFSAPFAAGKSIRDLAMLLRDQLFQAMKEKIPSAMEDAAALGRIFPRSLVAKVINSTFKARMSSFYFACVKETGFAGATFMGLPVTNIVHTPLAFAPPGLNLCMTFFGGRFNIVLSYLDGAIEDREAAEIVERFRSSLVA
jgi:hypothetical protein